MDRLGFQTLGLHSTLRYVDTPLTPSTAKVGSAPLIPPVYDHQPHAATKGTHGRMPPQFSSGTLFPHPKRGYTDTRPVCASRC